MGPFVEWYFDVCIVFFADETAKWEKITYAGIFTCTTLAIFILSKGHPHHEEPPVSFFWAHLNISNWSTHPWITRVLFLFAISLFIRWTLIILLAFRPLWIYALCASGRAPTRVSHVYFILWISYFLTRHFCEYRHTRICTFATRSSPGVCLLYLCEDLNLMVIWFLLYWYFHLLILSFLVSFNICSSHICLAFQRLLFKYENNEVLFWFDCVFVFLHLT